MNKQQIDLLFTRFVLHPEKAFQPVMKHVLDRWPPFFFAVVDVAQEPISTRNLRGSPRYNHVTNNITPLYHTDGHFGCLTRINNTDIMPDIFRCNKLVYSCWHNIKQVCYHAWYELLKQHCSRLLVHQPWTVLFEQAWTALLTTLFTGCSTTLFTPLPNSTVQACWQLAAGCAFLRVYYTMA